MTSIGINLPLDRLTDQELEDAKAVILRLNGGETDELVEAVAAELQSMTLSTAWTPDIKLRVKALSRSEQLEDGTTKLASSTDRRNFWVAGPVVQKWPLIAKAAARLLSVHVTSAAAERNWSAWGLVYQPLRNALGIETATKLIFCRGQMLGARRQVQDIKEIQLECAPRWPSGSRPSSRPTPRGVQL